MWVRTKGILGQQAGEADTGIATSRVQNGKGLVTQRGRGTYLQNITANQERPQTRNRSTNSRSTSTCGQADVGASEREDRGSDGLQKEFTREQAIKYVRS